MKYNSLLLLTLVIFSWGCGEENKDTSKKNVQKTIVKKQVTLSSYMQAKKWMQTHNLISGLDKNKEIFLTLESRNSELLCVLKCLEGLAATITSKITDHKSNNDNELQVKRSMKWKGYQIRSLIYASLLQQDEMIAESLGQIISLSKNGEMILEYKMEPHSNLAHAKLRPVQRKIKKASYRMRRLLKYCKNDTYLQLSNRLKEDPLNIKCINEAIAIIEKEFKSKTLSSAKYPRYKTAKTELKKAFNELPKLEKELREAQKLDIDKLTPPASSPKGKHLLEELKAAGIKIMKFQSPEEKYVTCIVKIKLDQN